MSTANEVRSLSFFEDPDHRNTYRLFTTTGADLVHSWTLTKEQIKSVVLDHKYETKEMCVTYHKHNHSIVTTRYGWQTTVHTS